MALRTGQPTQPAVSLARRNFMLYGLASLMTGIVVALIAPLLVFIFPSKGKEAKKIQVPVTLDGGGTVDAIREGQAVRFTAAKDTAYVALDGGGINAPGDQVYAGYLVRHNGKIVALSATCPHLGCSIGVDSNHFRCPCHGSQFAISGDVTHGPATAGMSHLQYDPQTQTIVGQQLVAGS